MCPFAASAQQPAPPRDQPVVVTSGDGVVQAVPDRAWIGVTAESRAANPRDAQRKNADAMKPVQDRLRAAGIPEDAIKTTVYDLQPDWDYSNNRRVLKGYVRAQQHRRPDRQHRPGRRAARHRRRRRRDRRLTTSVSI